MGNAAGIEGSGGDASADMANLFGAGGGAQGEEGMEQFGQQMQQLGNLFGGIMQGATQAVLSNPELAQMQQKQLQQQQALLADPEYQKEYQKNLEQIGNIFSGGGENIFGIFSGFTKYLA